MPGRPVPRIAACFHDLTDPRVTRTQRHRLLDIVTIALAAVLSGAETWVDIATWGETKRAWLEEWLELPNGIPSHDTFGRVFARIDPVEFEAGFLRWIQVLAATAPADEPEDVIAIDGKTVRRSGDRIRGEGPIHLVSAWATRQRLVLGQEVVADHESELGAIPLLLERLDLKDQIVTIDAIGCQREIARQIVVAGGDYVLALKANQATLLDDVTYCFAVADEQSGVRTVEKGHGRIETRVCDTISDPAVLAWLDGDDRAARWPGLRCIVRVTSHRQPIGGTPVAPMVRYYLSSLPGDARQIAHAVRSHWGIENGLHWVLDMGFREDENRTRRGHSATNLAMLRKLAHTLIERGDPHRKIGIAASRRRAGWDTRYLVTLLNAR